MGSLAGLSAQGSPRVCSNLQLASDIKDLKETLATQQSDLERRIEQERAKHAEDTQRAEMLHEEAMARKREQIEDITQENDELRQVMKSSAWSSEQSRLSIRSKSRSST